MPFALRAATTLLPLIATVQLRAQYHLTASPVVLNGGYSALLRLFGPDPGHLDGLQWQWAVVGEPQGGRFIQSGGRPHFLAPRVQVPTTFHIRATDPRNAANTAEVAIPVRPNLTLSTGTPTLFGRGEAEIQLMRGQEKVLEPTNGEQSPFSWEVIEHWVVPHGEAVQRVLSPGDLDTSVKTNTAGTTSFLPPGVSVPTRLDEALARGGDFDPPRPFKSQPRLRHNAVGSVH
jgi:hypothetical protein